MTARNFHSNRTNDDPESDPFLAPSSSSTTAEEHHHHHHHDDYHHDYHDYHDDNDEDDAEPKHEHKRNASSDAPSPKVRTRLLVTLFCMILAIEIGMAMTEGPATRLFESVACRQWYLVNDPTKVGEDGQVAEGLCKVKDVQTELAAVKGYMEFFDGLVCAFLAVPYGLLADRYGRRPTIYLNIPGFALNGAITLGVLWFSDIFPLRAIWLSSLAWVLGGGPVVAFAIVWTMMADVTEESERASIFFRYAVACMGADFISTAISSWLMTMNPWIPLIVGLGIAFVGLLFALVLPETIHAAPSEPHGESSVELLHLSPEEKDSMENERTDSEEVVHVAGNSYNAHPVEDIRESPTVSAISRATKLLSFIGLLVKQYRSALTPYVFIFRNKQILLLLTAFLVYRLSRGSSWFLVQYISTRYSWTIANANLLVSFKPALTVPLFLFALPALSNKLLRYMNPGQKDISMARASIICLCLGTLGIGLSPSIATVIPSLILQTCGSGFVYFTRSLVTSLVKREETARLYTVIEVLQAVGSVIASLSITNIFQLGLGLGGFWIGLAWMTTSFLFCLVATAIYLFRLPASGVKQESRGGDHGVGEDMVQAEL